jgi:hypothetical protein
MGGGSDGKVDHTIRVSLLCEPKKRKLDQVIIDDLASLYRSTRLVTRTHMHMYVPQVRERAKDKVIHTYVYIWVSDIFLYVYMYRWLLF